MTKLASDQTPDPASTLPGGKTGVLVVLLRQPGGTTMEAMIAATGWKANSVSGAIFGAIKRGLRLEVISQRTQTGRIYRIIDEATP